MVSRLEAALAGALDWKVRPRRAEELRLTLADRLGKLKRVGVAPEVIVKVTPGGPRGGTPADDKPHIRYLMRAHDRDLDAENERGQVIDYEAALRTMDAWTMTARQTTGRAVLHVVLSMPRETPPDALMRAARAFAAKTWGPNHQYLLVAHEDAAGEHPHVHAVVHRTGRDLRMLRHGPGELAAWREGFARELRAQGIDAEATPRHARGVVRKAERQAVRHMGARSRVRQDKVTGAVQASSRPIDAATMRWMAASRQAVQARQQHYLRAAEELEALGYGGMAQKARRAAAQPVARIEREELRETALRLRERGAARGASRSR